MKNEILSLIKGLKNLSIKEDNESHILTVTGEANKAFIRVEFCASIAHSCRVAMSRRGIIMVSCAVKVDGVTAIYEPSLTPEIMHEIGSYLWSIEHSIDSALAADAYSKIKDIIKD